MIEKEIVFFNIIFSNDPEGFAHILNNSQSCPWIELADIMLG